MAVLKSKQPPPGHSAGIYADMTLDGPEIGTLVVIVDRAKNLPNRKTMGKQDPYCAMRLAKGAKKTDTDRRGGQTPRWDQELRFTVHDSPDYYKLKCSVFNDDKKTDLIGEAWVDLKDIVKPGGGRNDFWQQLNFKGKYAGDIRIELTYYDTREKPVEKREGRGLGHPNQHENESAFGSGNGSRQLGPRDIPRRPLPANPVPHQTLGSSQTPPQHMPQPPPKDAYFEDPPLHMHAPVPVRPYEQQPDDYQDSYLDEPQHQDMQECYDQTYHHEEYYDEPSADQSQHWQHQSASEYMEADDIDTLPSENRDYINEPGAFLPATSSLSLPSPVKDDHDDMWLQHRPRSVHTHSEPSSPFTSPLAARPMPSPANSDSQVYQARQPTRSSISPTKATAFKDSPLRQSMSHCDDLSIPNLEETGEGPPPPPPKHRETPPRKARCDYPPSSYMPQPLRLAGKKASVNDRSPLQSIEDHGKVYGAQSQTSHRHGSSEPWTPQTPQQKVDAYNRRRSSFDKQFSSPQSDMQRPHSQCGESFQERAWNDIGDYPVDKAHGKKDWHRDQPRRDQLQLDVPSPSSQQSGLNQSDERTNLRFSMSSDGPYPVMDNRRLSGVPFSPDAYDVFNPGSSPVTNEGTRFETPEQARLSAQLREDENVRDCGPIIGNDGREIDPSDHLPCNTWAPEPEKKEKKPEHVIHIRSRNQPPRPTSNRSMPVAVRSSGSSPGYSSPIGSSPQVNSPSQGNGRNRLQKPISARPLPTQPYAHPQLQQQQQQQQQQTPPRISSVGQDSSNQQRHRRNSYRNDAIGNLVRPAPSEYQVPIGSHYGSGSSMHPSHGQVRSKQSHAHPTGYSPTNQRHSYYGGMNASIDNYDDPLAAEMSLIDIGPSRGPARRTAARPTRGY